MRTRGGLRVLAPTTHLVAKPREGGWHPRAALHALPARLGNGFRARKRLLLAVGLAIAKQREAGDPLPTLEARIQELLARIATLEQENGHLRSRLERIEARRRSHYTPSERFQILVDLRNQSCW